MFEGVWKLWPNMLLNGLRLFMQINCFVFEADLLSPVN